jgi:hypothetical protein
MFIHHVAYLRGFKDATTTAQGQKRVRLRITVKRRNRYFAGAHRAQQAAVWSAYPDSPFSVAIGLQAAAEGGFGPAIGTDVRDAY